jgi:hypothetical protein
MLEGITYGQSNNSFDRTRVSLPLMQDLSRAAMIARRSIRALGC